MWRIVIGAILLLGGLITLGVDDIPVIWTGGMIVGVLLMVQGAVGVSREQEVSKEIDKVQGKINELRPDNPLNPINSIDPDNPFNRREED